MTPRVAALVLLLLSSSLARAPAEDFDPTQFIGMDLGNALDTLGPPKEMFSYRGVVESQDNVVFFYPDYLYLFWYKNRVWQVRCDRRFAKPLYGLAFGTPKEQVMVTSTRALTAKGDSLYFDLDGGNYPLRVRLVFAQDGLTDVYVYRSDF